MEGTLPVVWRVREHRGNPSWWRCGVPPL